MDSAGGAGGQRGCASRVAQLQGCRGGCWGGPSAPRMPSVPFRPPLPCAPDLHVIIFDEIDAVCKSRGSVRDGSGVHDTVVNQLLTKIDGVDALNNILLIGMTNRWVLACAVRWGRAGDCDAAAGTQGMDAAVAQRSRRLRCPADTHRPTPTDPPLPVLPLLPAARTCWMRRCCARAAWRCRWRSGCQTRRGVCKSCRRVLHIPPQAVLRPAGPADAYAAGCPPSSCATACLAPAVLPHYYTHPPTPPTPPTADPHPQNVHQLVPGRGRRPARAGGALQKLQARAWPGRGGCGGVAVLQGAAARAAGRLRSPLRGCACVRIKHAHQGCPPGPRPFPPTLSHAVSLASPRSTAAPRLRAW